MCGFLETLLFLLLLVPIFVFAVLIVFRRFKSPSVRIPISYAQWPFYISIAYGVLSWLALDGKFGGGAHFVYRLTEILAAPLLALGVALSLTIWIFLAFSAGCLEDDKIKKRAQMAAKRKHV